VSVSLLCCAGEKSNYLTPSIFNMYRNPLGCGCVGGFLVEQGDDDRDDDDDNDNKDCSFPQSKKIRSQKKTKHPIFSTNP
jgi:hypothetical protein